MPLNYFILIVSSHHYQIYPNIIILASHEYDTTQKQVTSKQELSLIMGLNISRGKPSFLITLPTTNIRNISPETVTNPNHSQKGNHFRKYIFKLL